MPSSVCSCLLSPNQAYGAVGWRVLVTLAGILPLGIAKEKTGAAQSIADIAQSFVGREDPTLALAVIYIVTATLTECMINNGAAVLIAPVAISTAHGMGLDARPSLIAVTFAASTRFAAPVGYQTNTMVYNAGGYLFGHFFFVFVQRLRHADDGTWKCCTGTRSRCGDDDAHAALHFH